MVRLTGPSSWGTVRDPETDERVPLSDDVDEDVAERLADYYDEIEIDGDEEDDGGAGDEAEGEDETETETEGEEDLSELTHDELKERAEAEGIDDEIDLRSKEDIVDALSE